MKLEKRTVTKNGETKVRYKMTDITPDEMTALLVATEAYTENFEMPDADELKKAADEFALPGDMIVSGMQTIAETVQEIWQRIFEITADDEDE